MAPNSLRLDKGSTVLEAIKERRTAFVCAAAVAVMAIGVFHAPPLPVLLGCGGAVMVLVIIGCLKRIFK